MQTQVDSWPFIEYIPRPPWDGCPPWFSVGWPSHSLWFWKPNCEAAVAFELFWRLRFAMSQSRHSACGYLLTVAGTTRLPPPRSDDCRCRSTAAYLSDTKCPLGSQLTSISGGHSPISLGALVVTHAMLRHLTSRRCIIIIIICRLGRQLVADSSAPAAPGNGGWINMNKYKL